MGDASLAVRLGVLSDALMRLMTAPSISGPATVVVVVVVAVEAVEAALAVRRAPT